MIIDWGLKFNSHREQYHGGFSENVFSYSVAATAAALTLTALGITSLNLGAISESISMVGNYLPIEIVTTTPTTAPALNKGVVFKVSGGVATLYLWDGSSWIAK